MTNAKHTPGPWQYDDFGPNLYIVPESNFGLYIAVVERGDDDPEGQYAPENEVEANAALIAAAPELLEALETIMAEFASRKSEPGQYLPDSVGRAMARIIITKAKWATA